MNVTDGDVLAVHKLLGGNWYEFDYTYDRLQAYSQRVQESLKKK